jgi:hypothetical protein
MNKTSPFIIKHVGKSPVKKVRNKGLKSEIAIIKKCFVEPDNSIVYAKALKTEPTILHLENKYESNPHVNASYNIIINDRIIDFLPKALFELYASINKSKYILGLEDGWDGENGKTYKVETWKRAVVFLSKYATKLYKKFEIIIPAPHIYHGPVGSIDIYWENENFNLLLNVPEDGIGTFYGDDYNLNKLNGEFDPINPTNIFPFLIDING